MADNLGTWLFVCVLVHECVKHGGFCLFCLHTKERFLLSHPEGMKRHLEKQQLRGSQKEFIHSFCGSFGTLVEGAFCSQGLASAPVPAWHGPSLASSSPGLLRSLPGGPAGKPGFSQPRQPKAGLPPAIHPIPPLPKATCPDTFALNRVAFKRLGLPTHVKVRLEAKKKNRESSSAGGKGSQDQSPELGACTQ